jgi:hypothetical protein
MRGVIWRGEKMRREKVRWRGKVDLFRLRSGCSARAYQYTSLLTGDLRHVPGVVEPCSDTYFGLVVQILGRERWKRGVAE